MINAHFDYETRLWSSGIRFIAGIDEVGRGPLAGPVVAAAVIFPFQTTLLFPVRDSKKVTAKRREELDVLIRNTSLAFGIGEVASREVDDMGIRPASELAMKKAVDNLKLTPEWLLIDHFTIKDYPEQVQTGITHGDAICASIAAASIVAKVYRDHLMIEMDINFPQYGFAKHKGYGTRQHYDAIKAHGPSPHHRLSFIKDLV